MVEVAPVIAAEVGSAPSPAAIVIKDSPPGSTPRVEGRARSAEDAEERRAEKKAAPVDRSWVPKVFVPLFLLGVLWLIVYYIAGNQIPGMKDLGDWNVLIGMCLMAAGFGVATLWK